MLDLKALRAEPDAVRKGIVARGGRHLPQLEALLSSDARLLKVQREVEGLRSERNESSARIGKAKAASDSKEEKRLLAQVGQLKEKLQESEGRLAGLEKEHRELLLGLPNLPHPSVPPGKTADQNQIVREDVSFKRNYDFEPKDHQAVGEALGVLDFKRAAGLAGARFALLKGKGAALERALISFMLDLHIKEFHYTEVLPPLLVNSETLTGTGHLPKFEDDLFSTRSGGNMTELHAAITSGKLEDISAAFFRFHDPSRLFLIPTAEAPLSNLHRGEALEEGDLPLKYVAYTPCFRQEAGSYGKDTRGLIRNHQFNKVELVWFAKPEESEAALETLTGHAEEVLKRLKLPYRAVLLCAGDLSFASRKTYDLEVWMPGEKKWREVSSCSDCGSFQARRMQTKLRRAGGKTELVHTLNGSGLAVGRVFAAILENLQRRDGSVEIPDVLRPYLPFGFLSSN